MDHRSLLSATTLIGLRAFLQLEEAWRAILAAAQPQNPFLHWEWVSAWARHFCGDRLATVVVSNAGRVAAIAPFYRRRLLLAPGLGATCLQLFGPSRQQPLFELREILACPGEEDRLLQAVVEHLAATEQWDWLELATYETERSRGDSVLGRLPTTLAAAHIADEPVPVLPLEASWEAQRQRLGRNVKESIRRSYKALEREDRPYRFSLQVAPAGAPACLAAFHSLHRQRSRLRDRPAHADLFDTGERRAFLAEVAPAMMAAGHLGFGTVQVGDAVVASRIVLRAGDCGYLYYSGFDPHWWNHGAMTVLVTECLRAAIQRGYRSVNFSPGIDQSKIRWGGVLHRRRSLIVVRRAAGSRLKLWWMLLRRRLYGWVLERWPARSPRHGISLAAALRRTGQRPVTTALGVGYLLYLPATYGAEPARRWPLILFLHGSGERGTDLEPVKRQGLPELLERRDDFPFIVVSPQCPAGQEWSSELLTALLDGVEQSYAVDPDRIYVTGLSMGGAGAWDLAMATPERFAAIAPVAGWGRVADAGRLARLPVWAFHGANDRITPPWRMEEMVEALRRCGGNVRSTVYAQSNHDCWTATYADPELYTWFLSHTRTERAAQPPMRHAARPVGAEP
jgi:CelD/BcsL family acetyltransferase involved in cellulose biosynthesis/predicted esterase